MLGDDTYAANVALVHDVGRDDLEHDPFSGKGQQFLVRGPGSGQEQEAARRRLGAQVSQQAVNLVLVKEVSPLALGLCENLGHGREIDMRGNFDAHGVLRRWICGNVAQGRAAGQEEVRTPVRRHEGFVMALYLQKAGHFR
jgi:hypothetical protein